jgi:hypothetical protein
MARKSTLFINKHTDKNGNQFYIDRDTGKRRSNQDYRAQWNGNKGRVNKEVFQESVKQYKAFERTKERGEKVDIHTIVRGVQDMQTQRVKYKSHTKMLKDAEKGIENEQGEKTHQEGGLTSYKRNFYNMKDTVESINPNYKIMVLSPDGERYVEVDKLTAMSMVSDYAQNVTAKNDELSRNTPEGKTAPYVLPMIAMQLNMKEKTFYIDLKNPFGMEGNEGILDEINDMFE